MPLTTSFEKHFTWEHKKRITILFFNEIEKIYSYFLTRETDQGKLLKERLGSGGQFEENWRELDGNHEFIPLLQVTLIPPFQQPQKEIIRE